MTTCFWQLWFSFCMLFYLGHRNTAVRAVRNPVLEKVRLESSRCFPSPTFPSSQLHTQYLLCSLCFTHTQMLGPLQCHWSREGVIRLYFNFLTQNISQLHFQTQNTGRLPWGSSQNQPPAHGGSGQMWVQQFRGEAIMCKNHVTELFPKWTYLRETFWCL